MITISFTPVLPFLTLLLLIALGPILFEKFWHKYGKALAAILGLGVGGWLLLQNQSLLFVETLADYISFAVFLSALYIVSGGIYLFADVKGTPRLNLMFLFLGAILANIIGTTGASVLLIRPYIRLNKYRLRPYHIVFFIFIVSNAGGMLTPLGDPPLFFGFLKGVPFFWNIKALFPYWLLSVGLLCVLFYLFERQNLSDEEYKNKVWKEKKEYVFKGTKNFLWLGVLLGSLFLDPHILPRLPSIAYGEHHFSFIREFIQITVASVAFLTAGKKNNAYKLNDFSFEPIQEVVFLFFGLFFTMAPALQVVKAAVQIPEIKNVLHTDQLYWATGTLSAFLDNAPTYISMLSAAMAKYGLDLQNYSHLQQFISDDPRFPCPEGEVFLIAISCAAVLFGAGTYIGNGPNLMVKSIAESEGLKTPTFFGYIFRYSLPILLPVLLVIYLLIRANNA